MPISHQCNKPVCYIIITTDTIQVNYFNIYSKDTLSCYKFQATV